MKLEKAMRDIEEQIRALSELDTSLMDGARNSLRSGKDGCARLARAQLARRKGIATQLKALNAQHMALSRAQTQVRVIDSLKETVDVLRPAVEVINQAPELQTEIQDLMDAIAIGDNVLDDIITSIELKMTDDVDSLDRELEDLQQEIDEEAREGVVEADQPQLVGNAAGEAEREARVARAKQAVKAV